MWGKHGQGSASGDSALSLSRIVLFLRRLRRGLKALHRIAALVSVNQMILFRKRLLFQDHTERTSHLS